MQDSFSFSPETPVDNNGKTAGLWRDHLATPRQRRIARASGTARLTQADVLIQMLRDARSSNRALELPAIMAAGIAQHGARFNEIRSRGFHVENKLSRDSAGRIHSSYFLTRDPERDAE